MNIRINGKDEKIDKPIILSELIRSRGLIKEMVAIEHNGHIVSREKWNEISLNNGDSVEIVNFVCGG